MINAIGSFENIIKTLRTEVINQGQLQSNFVVNKDSVRGADLNNILNEVDVMSIDLNDVFIVFELLEDDNNNNYVIPENDDTISSIASYKFVLYIYGNLSHYVSQLLLTRFKTDDVATRLHNNGIYLSGIDFPNNTKEFINNTLWPRCDLTMYIQVRYNISKLTETEYFDKNVQISSVQLEVKKI